MMRVRNSLDGPGLGAVVEKALVTHTKRPLKGSGSDPGAEPGASTFLSDTAEENPSAVFCWGIWVNG
jgi:hypothetical protein